MSRRRSKKVQEADAQLRITANVFSQIVRIPIAVHISAKLWDKYTRMEFLLEV